MAMLRTLHLSAAGALLLAVCAATAAPAAAQDPSTAEIQSFRIPGWSFTPGVVIGALFDSNVAVTSVNENGKVASDKLFQMEPFGRVEYIAPRTTLSGGYQGSLRRYAALGSLDGTDHRADVAIRERVTRRLTLFANDYYSQMPTTDALELNDVPFQRTGARYNYAAGGVEARLTRSVDMVTRYETTWVDFARKDTILTGGTVNGLHSEVTHRFSDRASAGAEYGFRWANLNQGTWNLAFQDAGGVFRYRTGSRTTVDLSAGVAHLLDRNTGITQTGPYAKAGLTHRVQRATFGANYSRSYIPSLVFGGTNQSQEVRGYVQMPLNRNRFYLEESAAWRRTDPFVKTELARDSVFVRTVLGYAIQRWFRVEAYHAYTSQENRVLGGKVSRHLAGVQFVVSEPMRIR